jgi:hypothetical protein
MKFLVLSGVKCFSDCDQGPRAAYQETLVGGRTVAFL